MRNSLKRFFVLAWLLAIAIAVSAIFWYQDYIYNLPTPVPEGYQTVALGSTISLQNSGLRSSEKPIVLHFFNPYCPCSKFNKKHLLELHKKYGTDVNFVIVLPSKKERDRLKAKELLGENMTMISDNGLSKRCGVYSTPQAVILDQHQKIYYRGNYNTSRYCTTKETEYARIALEALLKKRSTIAQNPLATVAYGCSLPQPIL